VGAGGKTLNQIIADYGSSKAVSVSTLIKFVAAATRDGQAMALIEAAYPKLYAKLSAIKGFSALSEAYQLAELAKLPELGSFGPELAKKLADGTLWKGASSVSDFIYNCNDFTGKQLAILNAAGSVEDVFKEICELMPYSKGSIGESFIMELLVKQCVAKGGSKCAERFRRVTVTSNAFNGQKKVITDIVDLEEGIIYEIKTISDQAAAPVNQMKNYQILADESSELGSDVSNQLEGFGVAGGEITEVRYIVLPGGKNVDAGGIAGNVRNNMKKFKTLKVDPISSSFNLP